MNSFFGMSPVSRRLAIAGVLLAGLAACGGGNAPAAADRLGAVFQQAFGQSANSAPVDVTNAGLTLDVTAEPFAL